MEFFTLVPTGTGATITVFSKRDGDIGPMLATVKAVSRAAARYATHVTTFEGHGEFRGSWDSRADGRREYQRGLRAFEGGGGGSRDARSEFIRSFERLRALWREGQAIVGKGFRETLGDLRKHDRLDERPTAAHRGYGSKWRTYAADYCAKHPRCRPCRTRGKRSWTAAVDHISPAAPDSAAFWDAKNHQPI